MKKFRPRRPSAALVISCVALVIAMGGTSYAAFSLPKGSVGTKQLKNGSVTNGKIKDGAVSSSKIDTTGLTVPNALHANAADSATSATSATNATNATKATTATNATNAINATTAAALGGVNYVQSASVTNGPMGQNTGSVQCPSGTFVTGGGAFGAAGGTVQAINSSLPIIAGGSTVPNAWRVDMNNSDTSAHSFTVYAICAPLTNPIGPALRRAAIK
jgi:hypothetical protein